MENIANNNSNGSSTTEQRPVGNQQQDRRAGKKKGRRKTRAERYKVKKGPIKEYFKIVRDSENFTKYYKTQSFFKDQEEFEQFLESIRTTLPASFRINTFDIGQAKFLRQLVESLEFEQIEVTKLEQKTDSNVQIPAIQPLCWYPERFGWQMNFSRIDLKKIPILQELHKFIMAETDIGFISRQEAVSMIPPLLLDVHRGQSILDMCAAPGSKTAQLLEYLSHDLMKTGKNAIHHSKYLFDDGLVVANDVDNKRCYMLVHQSSRLNSPNCVIINQDASRLPNIKTTSQSKTLPDGDQQQDSHRDKFDNLRFDRILCDVPCSGDGTLRKNPDVWRKWTVGNANNFHGMQSKILKRGVEMLKKDGLLVYSTCSLNPIEDEAVIAQLLRSAQGAVQLEDVSHKISGLKFRPGVCKWVTMGKEMTQIESVDKVPAEQATHIYPSLFQPKEEEIDKFQLNKCIRILPHLQDTGGFFVAVLKKLSDNLPWQDPDDLEVPNAMQPINPKKRRFTGFKEDPFFFVGADDPDWLTLKKEYEIDDNFPVNQLVHRAVKGTKRSIYLVSRKVRDFILANQEQPDRKEFVKIINCGMKLFTRAESEAGFRICQDGVSEILPFIKEDLKVDINKDDLVNLLKIRSVPIDRLSEKLKSHVETKVKQGSFIMVYTHTNNTDAGEQLRMPLVAWKGYSSVTLYVTDTYRVHLCALAQLKIGGDLVLEAERSKKKQQKEQPVVEQQQVDDEEKVIDNCDVEQQ